MQRRPAPAGLKSRILERRTQDRRRPQGSALLRIAAGITMAATAAGGAGWAWHSHQEQQKGEEARRQVIIALRITGHALNRVQINLAAHGRPEE